MTTRRISIIAMFVTALVSTASVAQATGVDDAHGKEWRQLVDTTGVSWEQAAQVCPRDGVSACVGVAGGRDLTGWIWATESEVTYMFSFYHQCILTCPSVEGQHYFFPASSFLSAFHPTFSMFLTYQTSEFAAGWTSSTDPAGLPVAGSVGTGTTPVSVGGSFGFASVSDPAAIDGTRGVFLWRSTGLGTNAVIAYDDVGQVPSPDGGTAIGNVLANDWIAGARATTATVSLSQESSTSAGVTLDPATGAVDVARGTAATTHALIYRACETANPNNCAWAVVKVTVLPYV